MKPKQKVVICKCLKNGSYELETGKILTSQDFEKLEALMPDAQFVIIKNYSKKD